MTKITINGFRVPTFKEVKVGEVFIPSFKIPCIKIEDDNHGLNAVDFNGGRRYFDDCMTIHSIVKEVIVQC